MLRFFKDYYIYIIYTPNLGLSVSLPGRETEQGRFRGSSERAVSEHGRVSREHAGVQREHGGARESRGSKRQCKGVAGGSLKWAVSISA